MPKKKSRKGVSRSAAPKEKTSPRAEPGASTKKAKPRAPQPLQLSDPEQDLLSHMKSGYQLETDSLGSDVVLRNLKDDSVVRPTSVNRSTIEALQKRRLIAPGKSADPLRILWNLNKTS
jgi:hypothetical protein